MSKNLFPVYGSGRNPTGPLAFESIGEFYQPTVGEVMSAQFSSSLRSPGSSADDVLALELEQEFGTNPTGVFQQASDFLVGGLFRTDDATQPSGVKISQEEWKESPFFHPAVEYQEGMTTLAAELLQRQAERNEENEFIVSQAQGLVKNGLGYAAGFAGGMADAKGAAVGVAAAVAAGPIVGLGAGVISTGARIGPTLARMNSAGFQVLKQSRKARFAAIGGEAAVSTVPQVITGFQNSSLTQQDYEAGDALLGFAAAVGFSVAFQGATEGIAAAWKRYARQDGMVEVAQLATRQIELGEKINVQPIVQAQLADFTPTRLEVPEPTVRQLPDGQWEAALDNQIFVGRTQADVTAQAREIALSESLQPLREMGYNPQALARVEEIVRLKQRLQPDAVEQRLIEAAPEVAKAEAQLARAEAALQTAPKSQVKNAQRLVDSARQRVETAKAEVRANAQATVGAGRTAIEARITEVEAELRKVLKGESVKPLPDFARKQLDSSPEARAARSQNPEAARMVAQPIPEARGVDSEDVPLPTAQEIARVEAELADTPLVDDPKTPLESVKKALAEADTVLDDGFESSIERFVRCWGGR